MTDAPAPPTVRTARPEPALRLDAVHRTFRPRGRPERVALDHLTADFAPGQVHGLLGPNGAGKTTLCKIVATVLLPTSGSAHVFGHDVVTHPSDVRHLLGIVFGGERGLYGRLTAAENLRFWCAMYGLSRRATRTRVSDLLERVGLAGRADATVETFSRGMKQRLHLARGLVADPSLLLLDEPTVGMDPVSALDFRTLVTELRAEGRTILLTTHDMAEAEAVCDTLTFVDAGRIIGTGTPAEVKAGLGRGTSIEVHDVPPDDAAALAHLLDPLPGVTFTPAEGAPSGTDHEPGTTAVRVTASAAVVPEVLRLVVAAGHTSIITGPPSLQDVYVDLLGADAAGSRRGMGVG